MYRILKSCAIPALILLMLFIASCSTSTRTRRSIKKKCDCRKWSEVIDQSQKEKALASEDAEFTLPNTVHHD